jgi:DNA polymerase-3 subunit beta
MNFEINKERLKEAINKLKNSLAVKAVNILLEHFLFTVKDGILTIKSTNIKVTTVYRTKVECGVDFSFSLPGQTLAGLVSNLDDDTVVIEYDDANQEVKFRCGKYVWEASSGDTEDFPNIEVPDGLIEIDLPENFIHLLKSVYFSISNDSDKKDMNSLCIDINKDSQGKFNLISTDRIRLSYASFPVSFDRYVRFVIPKASTSEIIKLEPNKMMFNEKDKKSVYFKKEGVADTFILKTVLTDRAYPSIYGYIDIDFEEKDIKIGKGDLIKALKRIKLTSDKDKKISKFEFNSDKLKISTLTASSKAAEEVNADTSSLGEVPKSFNIDTNFILEYLNQEDELTVSFKIVEDKCLVFDKENYRHVLSLD